MREHGGRHPRRSGGQHGPNPAASFALAVKVPKVKGRPQDGVVTAFHSVGVRIAHTDVSDLALFLVSPGGRAVALATYRDQSSNLDSDRQPSPSGDGYGSGAMNCAGLAGGLRGWVLDVNHHPGEYRTRHADHRSLQA